MAIIRRGPSPLDSAPAEAVCVEDGFRPAYGSRKNKSGILGDEAPGRQGAKTQEYLDIPSFRNSAYVTHGVRKC